MRFKIAVGVIVGLCAFVGAEASALAVEFYPTGESVTKPTFEARQKSPHKFTINSSTVECEKAFFKGTMPSTKGSTTLKTSPKYELCKFAGEKATVTNEACEYALNEPKGTSTQATGTLNITGTKCQLTVTATLGGASCTVTLSPQKELKLYKSEDTGGGTGLRIGFSLNNITYTAKGIGCELAGIKSGTEAKYTGEIETEELAQVIPLEFKVIGGGNAAYGIFGAGTHVYMFKKGTEEVKIECPVSTWVIELHAAAYSLKIEPGYGQCKTLGGNENVTPNIEKCAFTYGPPVRGGSLEFIGALAIVNEGGTCDFKFVFPFGTGNCVVEAPLQTRVRTVEYKNLPGELEVKNNIANLTYKTTGCNVADGTAGNGEYKGTAIFPELTIG